MSENKSSEEVIKEMNEWSKLSFEEKMKTWLTWHKPFNKDDKNFYENNEDRNHYCPNCGTDNIRNNGVGFFRCNECKKRFIILEATE